MLNNTEKQTLKFVILEHIEEVERLIDLNAKDSDKAELQEEIDTLKSAINKLQLN